MGRGPRLVVAVLHRVSQTCQPPVPPDTLPPLVGRRHELALLDRHLSGQGPPLLLLAGEPGIGKSRLLHEAVRCAADRGLQVVQGGYSRRDAVGHPEEMVLMALEAACHAHVLIETDERTYQFAHDVIREVVEADLGAARRTLLHRRIAAALERMSGEPAVEALAYHDARSEDRAKAILFLERAGDLPPLMQKDGAHASRQAKPAWCGARPMEIPPWLWFSSATGC